MYNAAISLSDEKNSPIPREKWKIYLEEWGVALIVSLFIIILPAKVHSIEYSVIASIFFFMLFLFGGKGLINTLFRLFQSVQQKRNLKIKTKELFSLKDELETTMASLEELAGEEKYKICVFSSEFNLAHEGRQLANGVIMKKLA
jgi:hypothetical protein